MASVNGKQKYSPQPNRIGNESHGQSDAEGGSNTSQLFFLPLATVSQIVGLTCVILVIYWVVNYYKGFSWSGNADLQFNYHPVLMIFGLIFLYGDAMIVYRVLFFLPKFQLKIIHGGLHVVAIVSAIIGLVAVFENHSRTGKADLYSLHSWIGLTTCILFCLQYISGFVTFLLPVTPVTLRSRVLPFHQFFGTAIFIMAIASALMGLTEKLLWTSDYSNLARAGVVGNLIGVLLVIFGFFIVFLTTHSAYKRKPLPSEVPAPVN